MNTTSAVSIAFDPLLGWPVLAVLGGIGLVLALLGLRAGARGTIWRLASVLVVLAALANPALIEEQRKPIADVALVVTDDSDSMAIGERRHFRERLEIFLQLADLLVHCVLAVRKHLRLAARARRGRSELADFRRDLFLIVRQLFGLFLRILDVALRAIALVAIELVLRLAQRVERRRRLRAAVLRSVGRSLPHLLRRFAHLLRRRRQLRPLLFALQLLETPRRLIELVGELALALSAAATALLLLAG